MTEHAQPFHAQSLEEILKGLNVQREEGLSQQEAADRLREYGQNRLRQAQQRSAWSIFVDQAKSVVLIVLAVAAALAFAFGQWAEGIAIAAVLIVNSTIGFVSEWRAVRSMSALQKIGQPKARIRRGGQIASIPVPRIVPGDIV